MKLRSNTCIKTDRLWLRQIDETDADSIVALRANKDVYKYFKNPMKLTVDGHRRWYDEQYKTDDARIDWVAEEDETGDFIGVYGAKKVDDVTAELSYITKTEKQGKGYAKEAIEGITGWCVENWDINSFVVIIHRGNKASLAFANRLSFFFIGEEGNYITMKKTV